MTNVQCYRCKGFGHIATNCAIIVRKHGISSKIVPPGLQRNLKLPIMSSITPKIVQQMIVSTLSALGLSSRRNYIPKPWYFDSAASNHMTNTALPLNKVKKYKGDIHIRTVDGNPLPITAVDDISALLNTVFVSPKLSTNLMYVGLTTIMIFIFQILVVLCRIKCSRR
jgi:hypothetical protein